MKRCISIFVASAAFIAAVGCTEEPIGLFSDQNYIHFKKESSEAYRFSFATVPGTEEYEYKIPMTLIGRELNDDKEYKIEVVTEGKLVTTATSASFSLPSSTVFHKGVYEDELVVRLTDNPELSVEKMIVLRVADNDNFLVGPVKYSTAVLYVCNYLVQPEWWNSEMETIFLGAFSELKYQQFIIATGISDLSDKTVVEITAYVSTFVYYLREQASNGNVIYEQDGVTRMIDTIPYNNMI